MASLKLGDFKKDRELVTEALGNKNVCPYCSSTGGRLRVCGACNSVKYCSKSCQSSDWTEHKQICKAFQHVVEVMKSFPPKTLNKFLRAHGANRVFYVLLTLYEVKVVADLVVCLSEKHGSRDPKIIEVVISKGRIYDLLSQVPNDEFPPDEKRKLRPVPTMAELSAYPHMRPMLATRKSEEIKGGMIPRLLDPVDFDAAEFEKVKKFECMLYMQLMWIICEEGLIAMRLFGHHQIELATRGTLMDFIDRMDSICKKTSDFSKRLDKVERLSHKLWKKLNLKESTRQKINYPWKDI